MTYEEIKAKALKVCEDFDTAYDYGTAYVFMITPKSVDDIQTDGWGAPWAFLKDGGEDMPFYEYLDQLDFDPDDYEDEDEDAPPLGVPVNFETGKPIK